MRKKMLYSVVVGLLLFGYSINSDNKSSNSKILIKSVKTSSKLNIDKIYLKKNKGEYKTIIFETLNNDITMRIIMLFYEDGELNLGDNFDITQNDNNISVAINKKGNNELVKITLYYTATEEVSSKTKFNVYLVKK